MPPTKSAALLTVLLCTGCFSYKPVELVAVRSFQLTRLDAKGISASVGVELNNPNGYRIRVTDPDVALSINGIGIGKLLLDSAVTLGKRSSGKYRIPLHIPFQPEQTGLLPGLAAALLTGTANVGVKGSIVGRAGLLRKRFSFADERAIPLR
jgi:hypothetical protein